MMQIDYSSKQRNCKRNRICGDTAEFVKLNEQGSFKVVLCDGMGHGLKANILANLTMPFILNYDFERESVDDLSKKLLEVQPICSIRKMNHCTYTLVWYDAKSAVLKIVNYDNPTPMFFREGKLMGDVQWSVVESPSYGIRPQKVSFTTIHVDTPICIVVCGDGVTQSGVGDKFSFGWGEHRVVKFIEQSLATGATASEVATDVVAQAVEWERDYPHDDISCSVIKLN